MSAIFSPCGKYRYRLDREVNDWGIIVGLFGVNPSVAGVVKNDPTITKELGFARVQGWGKIVKVNPFAFISTDVSGLRDAEDPVGANNWAHINAAISECDILIPCWGRRAKVPKKLQHHLDNLMVQIMVSGKPVFIFGRTKCGEPMHPLMLPYSTELVQING